MLIFVLVIFTLFAFFIYIIKSVYLGGIPRKCNPKFWLLFKNAINILFFRNHIANRMDLIYRAYPKEKFVAFYELLRPMLLIKDPQLIGEMFVENFHCFQDRVSGKIPKNRINQHLASLSGIKWRQVRTKLVPIFSPVKLKMMCNSVHKCSQILNLRISEHVRINKLIDTKDMMSRFALDVIGSCVFGLEFNAMNDSDSEFRKIGVTMLGNTSENSVRRLIRLLDPTGLLKKLFNFQDMSPKVDTFFFDLLKTTKELRENESTTRNDFIQLMLNIRNKELADDVENVIFDDNIIASNMYVFFFAGFETISVTLSFCLYELALNPEIQERVRNEIKQLRDSLNSIFDYDALNQLTYMDMVLSETLRKYPPVVQMTRTCTETYQIPDSDIVLHPHALINAPIFSIHNDERYYENPKKFDPERFTKENIARRIPNTYMPFGLGPRMCIGLRFAKMEMKCCLVELLYQYKFLPCDKTDIPFKVTSKAVMYTTDKPIWLAVEEV